MNEEITAIQKELGEVSDGVKSALEGYNAELEKHGKASTEATAKVDELAQKFVELQDSLRDIAQKQSQIGETTEANESWGEQFVKSADLKALASKSVTSVRHEVKSTTINSNLQALFGDGTTVFPMQRQGVIAGDFVPVTVRQVLPSVPVSTDTVNALREASSNMSAAEVAQGALKPESDITFENYNVPIETVAHWIKVSTRLVADAPAIRAYVDTRLRDGLAQRVDAQLINGDGSTPNLNGFTNSGNFTAFTPDSGANLVDSINKAKWELWAVGNIPDVAFVNPADWGEMERAREGSNSGTYLYGLPGTVVGPQAHGIRVVPSVHITAGKLLVGAFGASSMIFDRQNATIEMGYVNDDFTRNLVTIRAEERLALGIDKASAIKYGDITS